MRVRIGLVLVLALAVSTPDLRGQVPGERGIEPVLRIGVLDGAAEYAFGQVTAVERLPDGRFLVLDASVPIARIYDPEGRHLRSFGGGGDGPGEFQLPVSATVRPDGIRIFDLGLQRLSHFAFDGEHLDTRRVPDTGGRIRDPVPLRGGWWMAEHPGVLGSRHVQALLSSRAEGRAAGAGMIDVIVLNEERVDTIASGQTGWVYHYHAEDGLPLRSGGVDLGNLVHWTVGGDSLVLVVDGAVGELTWFHRSESDEEPLLAGPRRSLGLERRSSEEGLSRVYERLREIGYTHPIALLGPEYQSYFSGALLDDRGWAWLQRTPPEGFDPEVEPGPTVFLVVPIDGRSAFEVELPPGFTALSIAGDLILGRSTDQFEVEYVEVYRLR